MANYSTGTWVKHGYDIFVDDECIATVFDLSAEGGGEEAAIENCRRIVACVNACAGLPQDALDGGWTALGMSEYAKSVEQQRDDLLAALKESRRELHACQAVIHLAGGFDPAYVRCAQESLKKTDAIITQAEAR